MADTYDGIETLIPHANFRWVWRKVPDHQGERRKVLQQAFTRPMASGVVWRDVPTVEESD